VTVHGKLVHGLPVPVTLFTVRLVPMSFVRMLALFTLWPVPGAFEFNAVLTGVVPLSFTATGVTVRFTVAFAVCPRLSWIVYGKLSGPLYPAVGVYTYMPLDCTTTEPCIVVIVHGKLLHSVPPVPTLFNVTPPYPLSFVRMLALFTVWPVLVELEFKTVLTGVVPVSFVATGADSTWNVTVAVLVVWLEPSFATYVKVSMPV
jgi:hypothetical protein